MMTLELTLSFMRCDRCPSIDLSPPQPKVHIHAIFVLQSQSSHAGHALRNSGKRRVSCTKPLLKVAGLVNG